MDKDKAKDTAPINNKTSTLNPDDTPLVEDIINARFKVETAYSVLQSLTSDTFIVEHNSTAGKLDPDVLQELLKPREVVKIDLEKLTEEIKDGSSDFLPKIHEYSKITSVNDDGTLAYGEDTERDKKGIYDIMFETMLHSYDVLVKKGWLKKDTAATFIANSMSVIGQQAYQFTLQQKKVGVDTLVAYVQAHVHQRQIHGYNEDTSIKACKAVIDSAHVSDAMIPDVSNKPYTSVSTGSDRAAQIVTVNRDDGVTIKVEDLNLHIAEGNTYVNSAGATIELDKDTLVPANGSHVTTKWKKTTE